KHRDDGAARAGRRAHLQRAAELALAAGSELLQQLPLEGEEALGPAVEREAGLGRFDPAPRAVEQLLPEPLLERADLEADSRLGHPEPLGGLGEALPLDDRAKCCELPRVHKHPLCMASHFRHDSVTDTCALPGYDRLGEEAGRTELRDLGSDARARGQRSRSAARSSAESSQSAATALARTCSGAVAPAITDATPGWEASPAIASSSSVYPRSCANASSASIRSNALSLSASDRPESRVP